MPNFRRAYVEGGTWFFTVNLLQRTNNSLLIQEIELLRKVVKKIRQRYPFYINAWVVLPEHMHAIWTLPERDSNFSLRWRLIKSGFSIALPKTESLSQVREDAGERGIWQRNYWEHLIKNELDYQRHFDYVHVNPLKHGLVARVIDWPYSTFHRYVNQGIYPDNWCGDSNVEIMGDD
jgi:putative transposase